LAGAAMGPGWRWREEDGGQRIWKIGDIVNVLEALESGFMKKASISSRAFVLVVFAIISYLIMCFCILAFRSYIDDSWNMILDEHVAVVVGLPMAAGLSFLIVILLPQAYGSIEFKVLGTSFKGAAGPVVLWILCFLVIVISVKVLW
jgi:hypothetical protein